MKPSAFLINVARGKVVDEAALIAALTEGRHRRRGLDCTAEEPLPAASPLWDMPNVLITPHTAGETRLRGQRDRSAAGESRPALARRDRAKNGIV